MKVVFDESGFDELDEEVGHVDLPEACQAGRNRFKNHWACMQGHGCASDGGGGHRVVAYPGLLPLRFAGCLRVCAGLPTGLQLMEVRLSVDQRLESGPQLEAASERVFEEALEESVQGVSIVDLQADQVKE